MDIKTDKQDSAKIMDVEELPSLKPNIVFEVNPGESNTTGSSFKNFL